MTTATKQHRSSPPRGEGVAGTGSGWWARCGGYWCGASGVVCVVGGDTKEKLFLTLFWGRREVRLATPLPVNREIFSPEFAGIIFKSSCEHCTF